MPTPNPYAYLNTEPYKTAIAAGHDIEFETNGGYFHAIIIHFNDLSTPKRIQVVRFIKHFTSVYGVKQLTLEKIETALRLTDPIIYSTDEVRAYSGIGRWRERKISRAIYYSIVNPNATRLHDCLAIENDWNIHSFRPFSQARDQRNGVTCTGQHSTDTCGQCGNYITNLRHTTTENSRSSRTTTPTATTRHTGQHSTDTCEQCYHHMMESPHPIPTAPEDETATELALMENDDGQIPDLSRNRNHHQSAPPLTASSIENAYRRVAWPTD